MRQKGEPKGKRKLGRGAVIPAVLALAAVLCYDAFLRTVTVTESGFAMDAVVTVTVKGNKKDAEAAAKEALEAIQSLEKDELSRFLESATVYQANANPGTAVPVSADLNWLLENGIDLQQKTGNAFDITLGAVSDLWDFNGESPQVPDAKAIQALLEQDRSLHIEDDCLTVAAAGALDLGAVGKGMACDVAEFPRSGSNAVREAVVSVGGSVLLWGSRDNFKVGIRNPFGALTEQMGILTTSACCVSTSGGYERFFEQDGVRYHHILDGRTGYPVQNGLASVTILTRSGAMSDALSTACFVLGYEDSLPLLIEYKADAVFIYEDGGVRVVACSLRPLSFVITDEAFHSMDSGLLGA